MYVKGIEVYSVRGLGCHKMLTGPWRALLQALVMLGGPAGRVDTVRAYALRSLKACHPDQVSHRTASLAAQVHPHIAEAHLELAGRKRTGVGGPQWRAERKGWMCRSPSSCRSWCSS